MLPFPSRGYGRPACPTLAAFLAYWLPEVVKPNLAPATYVSHDMFSRLYLVPDLGGRRLDRLQLSGVQ